ncbi:MAG: thiamine-phosphate kinase [Candidatus Gastranaerophilales bacterium]|nr:thiamine-phosphate kinase [Candidatus Gastranaerophilales bacterium]
MNKEFKFLNIISKKIENSEYLGDDCAYLDEYKIAISSDSLIEDVHFSMQFMNPFEIARKALLVNISDILASGAEPKYATINLSGNLNEKFIEEFYNGINSIEKEFNIKIIGGDLTKSEKITISITIIGSYKNRKISSRKNAKKDYIVAIAGEFGSSAQGLEDLFSGIKENYFTNYHKNPKLFPEISSQIATKATKPYAMMDSSDGLVDCLSQIAQKSEIGINIDFEKIPHKTTNKDFVLYGGEDYSLVVCLDEKDFSKIKGLVKIGTCIDKKGVFMNSKKIKYKAFDHFNS